MPKLSRATKLKARTVAGRGEEGPLREPGSELLLLLGTGRERESNARIDKMGWR